MIHRIGNKIRDRYSIANVLGKGLGVEINVKDNDGNIALHSVSIGASFEVAELSL